MVHQRVDESQQYDKYGRVVVGEVSRNGGYHGDKGRSIISRTKKLFH